MESLHIKCKVQLHNLSKTVGVGNSLQVCLKLKTKGFVVRNLKVLCCTLIAEELHGPT